MSTVRSIIALNDVWDDGPWDDGDFDLEEIDYSAQYSGTSHAHNGAAYEGDDWQGFYDHLNDEEDYYNWEEQRFDDLLPELPLREPVGFDHIPYKIARLQRRFWHSHGNPTTYSQRRFEGRRRKRGLRKRSSYVRPLFEEQPKGWMLTQLEDLLLMHVDYCQCIYCHDWEALESDSFFSELLTPEDELDIFRMEMHDEERVRRDYEEWAGLKVAC